MKKKGYATFWGQIRCNAKCGSGVCLEARAMTWGWGWLGEVLRFCEMKLMIRTRGEICFIHLENGEGGGGGWRVSSEGTCNWIENGLQVIIKLSSADPNMFCIYCLFKA